MIDQVGHSASLSFVASRRNMICSALLCDATLVNHDLDSAHERLAFAREKAGYETAAKFAAAVGLKAVTYRSYESGQNGFAKLAHDFARRLNVTSDWLLDGTNPPPALLQQEPAQPPMRPIGEGEIVEILRLDLRLPMGTGATVDDYIEATPFTFDLAYIQAFTRTPPHRLRLAEGVGDSMFPTLMNSDLVWIDSTQTMLNQQDKIWALSINGAAAIKRLRALKGGRIMVISDNPAVENYEVDADEVLIGGRVIRYARDL